MAYDAPTYDDFVSRFPIFNDTDKYPQASIEALIVEATRNVDTDWIEADYKPAIMYLTAHLLANDNSLEGAEVDFGSGTATDIASESFSGMSTSYKTAGAMSGAAASSRFGNTIYGRRYYDLLKVNKPPVAVA